VGGNWWGLLCFVGWMGGVVLWGYNGVWYFLGDFFWCLVCV
jgi:hypothetical protein